MLRDQHSKGPDFTVEISMPWSALRMRTLALRIVSALFPLLIDDSTRRRSERYAIEVVSRLSACDRDSLRELGPVARRRLLTPSPLPRRRRVPSPTAAG
jgi:hypothetical protein